MQLFLLFLLATALLQPARADDPVPAAEAFMGPHMPYRAFEGLPAERLQVAGASLRVAFAPGEPGQSRAAVLRWVAQSARMVADYYGRFPVEDLRLLIVPTAGGRIHGTTWGYRGAAIRIPLGREVPEAEMLENWVLPHEMVHLALPDLEDAQTWLEEGIATYVEAIARVQAGRRAAAEMWREFVERMPMGQPRAGDAGLDHTRTWGRTYWGGAIFCLLADVEIRRRSGNRAGLQQALRAIVEAGGNITRDGGVDDLLAIGDRATGGTALADLYRQVKDVPYRADLDGLWARLGVKLHEGRVELNEAAPLAAIRRAIVARARTE